MNGGFVPGIGIGIKRMTMPLSGKAVPSPEPPAKVSCYSTGEWIMSGIWRMDGIWKNNVEP